MWNVETEDIPLSLNFQGKLLSLSDKAFIDFISEYIEKWYKSSGSIFIWTKSVEWFIFKIEYAWNEKIKVDTQDNFFSNSEILEIWENLDKDWYITIGTWKSDRCLLLKITLESNYNGDNKTKEKALTII